MKTGTKTQVLLIASIMVFAGAIYISLDIVNTVWPCEFNICSGNVKTVTLASAYLYSGNLSTSSRNATASFTFSLNNPGSTTYITSLTVSSSGVTTVSTWYNRTRSQTVINSINGTIIAFIPGSGGNLTITQWADNSEASVFSNNVNFSSSDTGNNVLGSAKATSFTFYPEGSSAQRISAGQVFDYIISFQNGQSVSGSLIAQ
jgi:hypothetical protein